MVNVENCPFLLVSCGFLLVIWVEWKHSVCFIVLFYSSTLYSLFLLILVLEIFKFKYTKFFVRNSASISILKRFEQPCFWVTPTNSTSFLTNPWNFHVLIFEIASFISIHLMNLGIGGNMIILRTSFGKPLIYPYCIRDHQQTTFVILHGFDLLSKTPYTLFLMDTIRLDGMPNKIKLKIHALFVL